MAVGARHPVGGVLKDEVVEAEIDIDLEPAPHGFGRADELEVEPGAHVRRVRQLLGVGHELAERLVVLERLPRVGVRLVMLDHLLEVAREMGLRQGVRLGVGIREDRVDQDRPGDVGGAAARTRRLVPLCEIPAVPVHGKVRDPEHGQVEPGHDERRFRAAGRAVEPDPLERRFRPQPDRTVDGEERAVMGEGLPRQRLADDRASLAEARPRLAHVDAEGVVFEPGDAAPEADVERAPAEPAHHRNLAGQPQRVVPG